MGLPIFVRHDNRVYKAANRRIQAVEAGREKAEGGIGGGVERGTTATTITAKDF